MIKGKNTKKSHWKRAVSGTTALKVVRNSILKQLGMVRIKVYLCVSIPYLSTTGKNILSERRVKPAGCLWNEEMGISKLNIPCEFPACPAYPAYRQAGGRQAAGRHLFQQNTFNEPNIINR